jgi:hypothetical protein
VNESNMEHAQEAIEEFHTRLTNRQKKRRMWWGHHLYVSEARSHINVPHQVASEINTKNFQKIASWTVGMYKKGCQNDLDKWNFLHNPKSKSDSHIGAKRNLGPKRKGKQGEFAGTCTCWKCIPKGWLVVVANARSHDPVRVL